MALSSMLPMACWAEQHTIRSMLALSRRGTPPCLHMSHTAVILCAHSRTSDEWEAESCPPCSAGRWATGWGVKAGGGLVGRYSKWGRSMALHGTPHTAQETGTNCALLLLPRAGTSSHSGRTGRGRRRPGRTAGTAMTTSSWTWEDSSLHMGQVQCHHPRCPAPP